MLARVIAIATCLSICLSVTRRYCVKTNKARVMISSPSGSPDSSFVMPNFITKFDRGHSEQGRQTREGWVKSAVFYQRCGGVARWWENWRGKIVCFEVTFEGVKWWRYFNGGWYMIQIWGAAEEKARRPKSVFTLGTWRRDWLEERSKRLGWW